MSLSKEIPIKAVLLGEAGVGKTCIILRYINDIFSSTNSSTILSTFSTKKVKINENTTIAFNIWDTAGQEKFRAITKISYQDAAVVILVFDLTNKASFDVLKEYWFPQVKEYAPDNVIIAIAAAKCDLVDNYEVDLNEAESYAKDNGALFKKTSSLDNIGINELFQEIGEKILTFENFDRMIVEKRVKTLAMLELENNEDINNISTKNMDKKIKKLKKKDRCC